MQVRIMQAINSKLCNKTCVIPTRSSMSAFLKSEFRITRLDVSHQKFLISEILICSNRLNLKKYLKSFLKSHNLWAINENENYFQNDDSSHYTLFELVIRAPIYPANQRRAFYWSSNSQIFFLFLLNFFTRE